MSVDIMIVGLIFLIAFLLILTLFAFLWYSGLFDEIEIKAGKPTFQELEVAYKYARGSYKDCGALFTEAHSIAPDSKCIGIYYDCPSEVDDESMRYIIGIILNDKEKQVTEELKKDILSKGFQMTTFPAVENVVYASFPHRSCISVLIAVNRVIPRFREYVKEKKLQAYPLIEIYDGLDIFYAAPLSKQSEFFVYEALAESEEDMTSEQRTVEDGEEISLKEIEEIPDTLSSIDSLMEGGSKVEDLPSNEEILDSLEDKNEKVASNGSEASTESFEEIQMDS